MAVEIEDRDMGYRKVMRELKKLDNSYTAVGFFGHGGNPSNDIAARAAVNELGATIRVTKRMRGYLAAVMGVFLKKTTNILRIPARPFMRRTASLYKRKLEERKVIELNGIISGRFSARQALSRLGEWYVGRIKYVITKLKFTLNSGITIKQKGSSKPLISSGEMRNATTHREIMR